MGTMQAGYSKEPIFVKSLGKGSFGAVNLVKLEDGSLAAMKWLKLNTPPKSAGFENPIELDLSARLRHSNIICIIGYDYKKTSESALGMGSNTKQEDYITILLPVAGRGDLVKVFRETNLTTRVKLVKDMSLGLQFLHSQNVSHNDLKPGNVLVMEDLDSHHPNNRNNPAALRGIIADLGGSTFCNSLGVSQGIPLVGTPLYMSPERLGGLISNNPSATQSDDVWAVGLILLESIIGLQAIDRLISPQQTPQGTPMNTVIALMQKNIIANFSNLNLLLEREVRPRVSPQSYPRFKQVLEACLVMRAERKTVSQILAMPLFNPMVSTTISVQLPHQNMTGSNGFTTPPNACQMDKDIISANRVNASLSVQQVQPIHLSVQWYQGLMILFWLNYQLLRDNPLGLKIFFLAGDLYHRFTSMSSLPRKDIMALASFWVALKTIGSFLTVKNLFLQELQISVQDLDLYEEALMKVLRAVLNQNNVYHLATKQIQSIPETEQASYLGRYVDLLGSPKGYRKYQNELIMEVPAPMPKGLQIPVLGAVMENSGFWQELSKGQVNAELWYAHE